MKRILSTAAGVAAGVVVLALAATLIGLPSLANPFSSETVVRDHAAVLESLEDLADLHSATGEFQVVIDVEERTRYVPGFLKGQRTTFLAQGSVDAVVSLEDLGDDAVIVDEDGGVTILLPPARLADPVIDHDASGVLDRDRGLVDRIGGVFGDEPTSDKGLYLEATNRLTEAAAESELRATGESNAADTVERLLREAGMEQVRVIFASPGAIT